jgi:cold-inducible RNA-binding protein
MVKKLYVGNMSYDTTEDALRALFAGVGGVESVNIITDGMSGRPRGFGFVEMAKEGDAQTAISQINGATLDDRQIHVRACRQLR